MGWGGFLPGEEENGAVSEFPSCTGEGRVPQVSLFVIYPRTHLFLKENKGPSLSLKHPTAAPSRPAAPGAQDALPGSQAEAVSGGLTRGLLSHQPPPEAVSPLRHLDTPTLGSHLIWNFP